MDKNQPVDYVQAMREFDSLQGKTQEQTDLPMRGPVLPDGSVDYLKISKDYERMLIVDQSEVVRKKE